MTIGILFVCTANICRSPTAEGVFRSLARDAGLEQAFVVDSAGTFAGHAGQPPSLPAIKAAARRGYDIADLRARLVKPEDILRFDHVLAMDRAHLPDLRWMSSREYRRVRPGVREGSRKPTRSYFRSVVGCNSTRRAATLMTYRASLTSTWAAPLIQQVAPSSWDRRRPR